VRQIIAKHMERREIDDALKLKHGFIRLLLMSY